MMKCWLPLFAFLGLAACGAPSDRLTDEQASAEQVPAVNDTEVPEEPEAAPLPAIDADEILYRAVGTEPGWSLTVRRADMDYEGNYGEVKISEPTPSGFRAGPGRFAGKRLRFAIAAGPCSDGMSDLTYRHKVRISADGQAFTGCGGGTLAPDGLAGTSWSVTAINDRPTGGGERFFLNFAEGRVSGRFGCNQLGGSFTQNGDHLIVRNVAMTQMFCDEEMDAFEREGAEILTSNVRVELSGGRSARLVSEAGEIDLNRSI